MYFPHIAVEKDEANRCYNICLCFSVGIYWQEDKFYLKKFSFKNYNRVKIPIQNLVKKYNLKMRELSPSKLQNILCEIVAISNTTNTINNKKYSTSPFVFSIRKIKIERDINDLKQLYKILDYKDFKPKTHASPQTWDTDMTLKGTLEKCAYICTHATKFIELHFVKKVIDALADAIDYYYGAVDEAFELENDNTYLPYACS